MPHIDVALREFRASDLARLDEWAKLIDSKSYMSRYRPKDPALHSHSPEHGLLWFVIQIVDAPVGAIWLERGPQADLAILGILLGDESLCGRGIGEHAIRLALEKARETKLYRKVLLNVRQSNVRAIACYSKCGFTSLSSDTKRLNDGSELPFVTMEQSLE